MLAGQRNERVQRRRSAGRILWRCGIPVAAAAPLLAAGLFEARASGIPGWHQDGQASYYSMHWVGRRTSSGAVFDPRKMTCAHASLPLGSRILVTSAATGESVVVTVNDREPPHGHRIVDLSPAAAAQLHMLGSGVAEVELSAAGATDMSQDDEVAEAPDDGADAAIDEPAAPRHRHVVHPGRHHRR